MSLFRLASAYLRSRILLGMSALAIALGVAVLFAVRGVMDGYSDEVERSLRAVVGDAVVLAPTRHRDSPSPASLARYRAALASLPGLASAEPRIDWYGLLGRRAARSLDDPRSSDLSGLLLLGGGAGSEEELVTEHFPGVEGAPIFLAEILADRLGLRPGDAVEVLSFRSTRGGHPTPVRATFRLAGWLSTGRYDQDLDRALVHREDLARMLGLREGFTEILLRGRTGVDPETLAANARRALREAGLMPPGTDAVRSWRDRGGNFLRAVEDQKGILSAVFFFIVLVAAYQLVATLTLTVAEKRRDIGVLGALGAGPGKIVSFFTALGLLVAAAGSGLGLLLGWWLVHHLHLVERWIGGGQPIFTPEVYKFQEIPVRIEGQSILVLVAATLSASLLFSFLPAWRAARMKIVDALRR